MYANLRVELQPKGGTPRDQEILFAWQIRTDGTTAVIQLDGNDGTGNYAEEIGERRVDLAHNELVISADF